MKYLGQHFLKDQVALKKIVKTLDLKAKDVVIEIGPGHGELTKHILKENISKVIAIEKDRKLAAGLVDLNPKLQIETGDALEILPELVGELKNYKIVSNLPYYISGELLRLLGELQPTPNIIVLMLQKEVAERACAKPPRMNKLAAILQGWADLKYLGLVPRESFSPPPEVDSAVIKITPQTTRLPNFKAYEEAVRAIFAQPRKTIWNNLRKNLSLSDLEAISIDPNLRPQDLSRDDIEKVSMFF